MFSGDPDDDPSTWQAVHCVFTLMVPVSQLGVDDRVDCLGFAPACVEVCVRGPPWQVMFEQVLVALSKAAAPPFPLYAGSIATSTVPS